MTIITNYKQKAIQAAKSLMTIKKKYFFFNRIKFLLKKN